MKRNYGITLVSIIIMVIVMMIIAGISVVVGNKVVIEAREKRAEQNLITVKAAINREISKAAMSGIITPGGYNYAGVKDPVLESTGGIQITAGEDWYLLDTSSLKQIGVEEIEEKYLVNYILNAVIPLSTTKDIMEAIRKHEIKYGYKKDGLILWLDGIDNTGKGYSSVTTVWRDLSGNENNGTLSGFQNTSSSGWSNNSLVFDGVNAEVNMNIEVDFNNGLTVECKYIDTNRSNAFTWLLYKNTVGTYVLGGGYAGSTGLMNRYYITNSSGGSSNAYAKEISAYMPKDTEATVTNVVIPSENMVKIYVNGNKVLEYIPTVNILNISSNKLALGRWNLHAQATIYRFSIYNRVLSDDEILHNYEVDVDRYGK